MFITALFIIARTWKQPRCPSADEWIRKLWYIYTVEYTFFFIFFPIMVYYRLLNRVSYGTQ